VDTQIEQNREKITKLCRQYHVQRLAAFCSALRGDFDPQRSDIDFLVEFQPLPAGSYADAHFRLKEGLEESLFTRPVDLVIESAIRNPSFLTGTQQDKHWLFAA
jgi:predicted nucleotidyltransferase